MPERGRGAALITGGARRIGRALTRACADAGFDVAIHVRIIDDDAEAAASDVRARGRRAHLLTCDLRQEAATVALVGEAESELGPVTLLVNNASVFEDDSLASMNRASWDAHMETNLRAPVVLAEAFAAQAPDGGCIVNLLDQRVLKPDPRFFSYALSRNALWWATRTLAQALAPRIRVNGVGPGPTLPSIHQTEAEFASEAAGTLLQRPGSPQAVAEAVRWLVEAELVTGQMIAVDGGQHLGWKTPDIVE